MEAIQQHLDADPSLRVAWERNQVAADQRAASRTFSPMRTATLTGPVTIPVIVHVVLPNPNVITDAQVDYFLNRLNLDFSGLNPDSTNSGTFAALRGHSQIRFTRARRTPNGQLTNGVERRVGTVQVATTTYQAIKHASAGGLDPWDITKYYNLWVGDAGASGLLGIAPNIGPGAQTETTSSSVGIDGICVDYRGFSNGCFSYAQFNLGRTAVHEIGHNFGLYHINGDATCGNDFKQLSPATPQLPDALLTPSDDTPTQSALTSGCPAVGTANGCSPSVPKMFQDYMDYTDDACYSMFSKGQVARMEYVLEFMRPGYLTTDGATPPAGTVALDVTPTALVAPGGSEFNNATCTVLSYPAPTCAGATVPRIQVTNAGTTTITSVTVSVSNNGGAPVSTTATGLNILTGYSATVVLPSINLVTGNNTLVFTVSNPNGGTDQNAANNTFTTSITIAGGVASITEGFESTTFPPTGWTLYNPNGDVTWQRRAGIGFNSSNSMWFNNWDNNGQGRIDELRSSPVSVAPTDNVGISFDLAHKWYSLGTGDTLAVLVSPDCGATWTEVYKKWGAALATAGALNSAAYVPAAASEWRRESITVPAALLNSGNIQVAIRCRGKFGNNIFVDNINISKIVTRDLTAASILAPGTQACSRTITPQVQVRNNGTEAVSAYNIGYKIDNGAVVTQTITTPLAPGASTTITFTQSSTLASAGAHSIAVFTSDPITVSGIGDQAPANDTVRRNFTVLTLGATPLTEGFENAFPPIGWTINNPDADLTWTARSPGRNSLKSLFIDNWNNTDGRLDEIRLPALDIAGADSVAISFDVAYKEYAGSPDTLAVYTSADCANSFTSVYKKSGATLATAGASTTEYTSPSATDWRRERALLTTPAQLSSGSLIAYFRNTSRFGNNIFVDNVNIYPYFGRDLAVVAALPGATLCDAATTPKVTVKNVGTQTITQFKVAYTIGNGTPVVQTVNNANLLRDSSVTITLANATFPTTGSSTFKVWTYEPVSATGTGDAKTYNDTLTRTVTVASKVNAPLAENFSASSATNFPPAGWSVVNTDNATTWSWNVAGNGNAGSAMLKSFTYAGSNVDDLVTPVVQQINGADSLTLSFDVASASAQYPGTTVLALDTLEVLATADCGATYQSVYKKWGQDLQTVLSNSAANFPQGTGFVPAAGQWRSERIDVSNLTNQSAVQFVFRASSNNGNNIYIDNVNVTARVLPANLKANGYVITPNPTYGNTFRIWHLRQPTTLRFVNVYDAKGALVWSKSYGKNGAENVITVDLSGQPAGVYMVTMSYEDDYRNVTERVIKH